MLNFKNMKKRILSLAFAILSSAFIFGQDSWTNVVKGGLNGSGNHYLNSFHIFNGELYVAGGSNMGYINKTSTGNPNDWAQVLYGDSITMFSGLNSTTEGGGKMFAIAKGGPGLPSIYQTTDGSNWNLFYKHSSYDEIEYVFPFKGQGAVDSIYAGIFAWPNSLILRAAYNTLDTTGFSGSWDTVLDFSAVAYGTRITSIQEHNGKIFLGTNLSTLWSSSDGVNWVQNANVGNGFGNGNNYQITALASFGGYLYVGTENGTDGAQLWRSNDETTWTLVQQFPTALVEISSLANEDGKLWVALRPGNFNYGVDLYKSTDGTTFTVSVTNGFGDYNNNGYDTYIKAFGNNIYWTGENYYAGRGNVSLKQYGSRGGPMSAGSEIWRLCITTPPTVNLGSDQTVCAGTTVNLDAGTAVSYLWNDTTTNQTLNALYPGQYWVSIVGANGCSAADTFNLNNTTSPTAYITSPQFGPTTVCAGAQLNMTASANSNLIIPSAPIHKPTSNLITDYFYSYDTIAVSGIVDSADVSLYSVTIDSLEHTYVNDVELRLYAPNGSSTKLYFGYAGGGQNMMGAEFNMMATNTINSGAGPFTGAWLPEEPFNWLNGNSNGNWYLEIYDHYSGDTGILKGWSIRFADRDTVMTYAWTPAAGLTSSNTLNTQLTASVSQDYIFTATNALGCSSSDTTSIFVPTLDIFVSNDSLCFGDSATLSAVGQNIIWSPGTTLSGTAGPFVTAYPVTNTMYYAQDTVMGCFVQDSALVSVSPTFSITTSTPTICATDVALAYGMASGGIAPYSFNWIDGTNSYSNDSILVTLSTTTSYTVTASDAFGCVAIDLTTINVTPSTAIFGNVTYSGGVLSNGGTAVLYNSYPFFISFDTVQTASIDGSGNYLFTAVPFGDYIVKVFPNATYPTTIPTYSNNTYLWDAANVIVHGCNQSDTANVLMVEQVAPVAGPGLLGGRIVEGTGFGRLEGDPIPGIDVKLGRNPGGALVTNTTTDVNGVYTFTNLPLNDGGSNGVSYTVYVDIPGLGRDSSYTVTIDATTPVLDSLNYMVDSTTIYIVPTSSTGISNPAIAKENKFNVYPNPFNENTTIAYTLNVDAEVRLEIYNVLGVKIESIVNTKQQAGEFKYVLDNKMNAGVYFISLTINDKTATQRVVKMK